MKNWLFCIVLIGVLISGCTGKQGIFGQSSKAVDKQQSKIEAVDKSISALSISKVNQVSQLSYGMDYSLSKVTNTEPAVVVTKELNDRVQSIVGLPALEQQKAMVELVSNLISNRIQGEILLKQKDKEIEQLQNQETILLKKKDAELAKLSQLATEVASKTDTVQAELDSYKGMFGLKAVGKGIKQFVTTSFWFIVIGIVVFFVLRSLAVVNPICGAIFGIFESVIISILHLIQSIFPKAVSTIQSVEASALSKVVDAIEWHEKNRDHNLENLKTALAKNTTDKEKAVIKAIKESLLY